MEESEIFDIAVVGGGISGVMAYLRAALNMDRTLFFVGSGQTKKRARGTWIPDIENIPGFHGIKHPTQVITKSTLEWIEKHQHLAGQVVKDAVTSIQGSEGNFQLTVEGEQKIYRARYVILATGVMDIQPTLAGSIKPFLPFANKGYLIYCIRCDGHRAIGSRPTVIGSRESAVQTAILLKERYRIESVTILTQGKNPDFKPESAALAARYGISVYQEEIQEILGDAKSVGLTGYRLASGRIVETNKSFILLGVVSYNKLLVDLGGKVDPTTGQVLVNSEMESSVKGVFIVGDLAFGRKLQIYTAWDEAVDAAEAINLRLRLGRRFKI